MSNKSIPQNWTWEDLGECVDILDRHREPINQTEREERLAEIDENERVPYYGATGQVGWIDDYIFNEELVLLGEDGAPFLDPFNQTAYMIRGKGWVNNHAHVLRGKPGYMNNKFLLYYLNTVEYKPYITGTTRHKLNQTRMKEIQIPVAPISEQEHIVAKIEELFSKLDSGVGSLNKTEERLDLYQSSIIKSALTGKLTETWRSENQTSASGADLVERAEEKEEKNKYKKRGKLNDISEDHIFEVPRSWGWAQVGDICRAIRYGSSEKADYEFEGVPLLRMGNIQNGKLNFDDLKYLPTDWERQELMLTDGDILFNRTNSAELVGKTALYKENHPRSTFASYLVRARVYPDIYNPALLVYFTNSVFGKQYINSVISQQVGQANVNATKFASMPIPVPSTEEQNEIVRQIDHRLSIVHEVANEVESNIKRSSRLRQSILKHAFEGKLVPQSPTEEPPAPDGGDTNLEPGEQATLSEVTNNVE